MMTNAQPMLSRRALLKGGALIVGFNIAGSLTSPMLSSLAAPAAAATPDPDLPDSSIAVHADNTATVSMGKREPGQSTTTAMPQIAAVKRDTAITQESDPRGPTTVP